MKRFGAKIATLLVAGFCLNFAGEAGPVTLPTSGWVTEPFTSMSAGGMFPDAYTISSSANLLVTGYYVTGEYYNVFVNGNLALTTAQVGIPNVDYGDGSPSRYADPASAFASGLFSGGQLKVNAGDTVTIVDLYPPSGIGEVGVEQAPASQATPEPGTLALIAGGFCLLFVLRQRLKGHVSVFPRVSLRA